MQPIGRTLKTPPAYIGELPPGTSPETIDALYEAEATRINHWINVGFLGFVEAVEKKEEYLLKYSEELKAWHAESKKMIEDADQEIEEVIKPKRKFLGIKLP